MSDPGPARQGWTLEEQHNFERAHSLLGSVIAAYSSLIGVADAERAEELRRERRQYVLERNRLAVHDHAAVQRVLEECPGVLRRFEAAGQ
ncbi:hypothetical protein [Streptomyces marianii]|uniref:Uncharacterized protein n=1 Tax=Streptomyces marianii TaxID=1817406 RepID=A0A5R9DTD3_9ACTN|nr:hypothetical protein [Streptomyces marianii]TLQ38943.1 hypothetical protein FEF34_39670 [Streptomyces marianii]